MRNRMQVLLDFQNLYVIEFHNQTVFFSVFLIKKLISRKVLPKFQNCLLSMPSFEIWYQTTVSMTYQIGKSKKTFSFVFLINQFNFHYQDCFFFKWFFQTKSLIVIFKEVFFLKLFSSWRLILTTLYLIFVFILSQKHIPVFELHNNDLWRVLKRVFAGICWQKTGV